MLKKKKNWREEGLTCRSRSDIRLIRFPFINQKSSMALCNSRKNGSLASKLCTFGCKSIFACTDADCVILTPAKDAYHFLY